MKFKKYIVATLLLLSFSIPSFSKDLTDQSITVIAEAQSSGSPDQARIVVHFTSFGWTVEKSKARLNQTIQKFIDKLSKAGIAPSQTQIGDVRLKPSYQFNRDLKANVPADFLVSRPVRLTLDDPAQVEKVMDNTIEIGSFLLESVRLGVKDRDALRRQAFANALEEGKRKAAEAAKLMNAELGEVAAIEELDARFTEINVIQDTDFSWAASAQLRDPNKPDAEPSIKPKENPNDAPGFASEPANATGNSDLVTASSKLRITFTVR